MKILDFNEESTNHVASGKSKELIIRNALI